MASSALKSPGHPPASTRRSCRISLVEIRTCSVIAIDAIRPVEKLLEEIVAGLEVLA
jgi:hypothetical protein